MMNQKIYQSHAAYDSQTSRSQPHAFLYHSSFELLQYSDNIYGIETSYQKFAKN